MSKSTLETVKQFLAKRSSESPMPSKPVKKSKPKGDGSSPTSSDGCPPSSDESKSAKVPTPTVASGTSSEPKLSDESKSSAKEKCPTPKSSDGSKPTSPVERAKALLAEKEREWNNIEIKRKAGFAALRELRDGDGRTTRFGNKEIRQAAFEICLRYEITTHCYIVHWLLKKYEDAPASHPFEVGRRAFLTEPGTECPKDWEGGSEEDKLFFSGWHHERRKNPKYKLEHDAS